MFSNSTSPAYKEAILNEPRWEEFHTAVKMEEVGPSEIQKISGRMVEHTGGRGMPYKVKMISKKFRGKTIENQGDLWGWTQPGILLEFELI